MRSFGRRLCLDAPNAYPLRFPPNVEKMRHKGLLFGMELVVDKDSRVPASNEKVAKVTSSCEVRRPIVGEKGGTVAGFNNDIALAPRLIAVNVLATL